MARNSAAASRSGWRFSLGEYSRAPSIPRPKLSHTARRYMNDDSRRCSRGKMAWKIAPLDKFALKHAMTSRVVGMRVVDVEAQVMNELKLAFVFKEQNIQKSNLLVAHTLVFDRTLQMSYFTRGELTVSMSSFFQHYCGHWAEPMAEYNLLKGLQGAALAIRTWTWTCVLTRLFCDLHTQGS